MKITKRDLGVAIAVAATLWLAINAYVRVGQHDAMWAFVAPIMQREALAQQAAANTAGEAAQASPTPEEGKK